MKKGKTRKLTRRILSIVLTVALVVGLMPGNILMVSAEGTDTVISDELIVESVSSNDASATTECTCETDDPAFHATNCRAYIAPENPQCTCAEKCTDDTLNVWCDVCGMQGVSACQGEDTAVAYAATTHDINTGSLEISSDGDYTITGDGNTTSNTITIKSNVTANVILSNVSIGSSNTPIDIETGATLNLTLLGENTLTSNTNENAALHVPSGAKLVITDESTGSLNATGGSNAAGIGGGDEENSGDVEIHGGTITAKMQHNNSNKSGAGIGGGYAGSNGSVTITGGYVNASATNGGAGIGAGYGWGYNGGTVTITGGTVIVSGKGQYKYHGAGIGGGHNNGNGGTVVITGGNVQAIAGDGAEAIGKGNGSGSSGTLKDSAGNDISLKEIALYGASDKTSVTNIVIDGSTYGSKDVVTIGDKLYLYLPVGIKPTSVTAGGYTYVCYSNGQMYQNHSDWVEATCTSAKHCSRCGLTEGEALPHSYVNGVCTLCGKDEQGTFHIKTSAQLEAFAQYVNAGNKNTNAVLDADIDMDGVAWTPICQTVSFHNTAITDTGYTGTFDGNGHTISNLTVTGISGGTYSYGLFGTVSGTVKHLGMDGFEFTMGSAGDARAGSVAGQVLTGGTIENCYSIGHSVTTNNNIAGGIAGCNYGGTIRNCYAYNGSVSGYETRWGGVVGDCQDDGGAYAGTVTNCYTNAERVVSTQNDSTKITNCEVKDASAFASGEVTYKLNGSTSDGDLIWYQTLGTHNTPNFTGDIVMYSEGTYTNHTHEWIYSLGKADESSDIYDKIVAECTIDGCKTGQREIVFKHIEEEVYLASEEIYGSFELEIISNTIGIEPTITYVALEGELTDGKPSKPGKYKVIASLTDSQDKTVSVEFTFEIIEHLYAGKSGTIFWGLAEDGTLYVNGEGRIPDYFVQGYYDKVQKIVIKDGITGFDLAFKYTEKHTVDNVAIYMSFTLPNLKYIEIPGSVEGISRRSFSDCDTLETIVINEGVKAIYPEAFIGSNNIQSVNIPDSVVELDGSSFREANIKDIETSCRWKDTIVSNGTIGGSNPISGTVTYTHPIEYSCSGDKIIYGCPCGETKYEAALRLSLDEPIYYTGEEVKPAVTITYPEGWGDIKTQPTAENCVYTNNTNAGTATCTFQFAEGIKAKLNYTINKATPIVEAPAVKNEISYGESLSNVGLTEGWSWQDGEQIPDVNNNGCVAVKSLTDDNNYDYSNLDGYSYDATNHTLSYNLAVPVNKAQPTIEMFTYIESTVYDGIEKSANVVKNQGITGMGEITVKYYQNDIEVTPVNVGTYTVKIDVAEGDNYVAATDIGVGTFEITKANTVITWNDQTLASTGAEADITAPTITFAGTDKPEVELTYSYKVQGDAEYTAGLPSDCGIYDVKVNVSATDNYNAVEDTMTLTITCTDADNNGICDHCGMYEAPEPVDGYYHIANAGNLMWFAQQVNEGQTAINAKLTADIDMKDIDWTTMSSFAGTFDGDGHTILYLCADENGGDDDIADGSRCGLFQTLAEGGTVTNLTISGAQLWSAHSAGAIAAVNNGTISKCIVKDSTIELGASHGLAAIAGTNTGTVTDCGAVNCFLQRRWGSADKSDFAIGAVVEDNSGTVSNCFSYGCTFSNSPNLYAIVESGNAPVNCYYYTGATVSDTVATAKTADQFASGEVAYLLNGEKTDGTQSWYQTLKTDIYPVPDNSHGTVYYGYADCRNMTYANTELSKDKPEHSWKCELDEANTNKMTFSCTTDGCTKGGTITVTAPEGAIYDGNNHTATVTVETEENEELLATPVITYDSLTEGVELVGGKPVNAGTYTANLTVGGKTATVEFTIAKVTPDIGTVSASNMENTLDVSEVVLSRSNETVHGTLSLADGTTLQYGIHDYTYVFTPNDNTNYETVTGTVSITITDTNAPTATYKVGTDGWKQFINTITFGHFCKDYTTVDITYSDEGSGVADKQYYISNEEITNTENIQWSEYTDTLNINATGKYYIYVRVTDNYGNVVIQSSEGIVVYAESVITPTSFSCEYGEENDLSVNISTNGNTFANLTDGSGNEIATENYSIDGSTLTIKGEYLSDLDVGEYTYKICMNPQGVENTEVTLAYSFVVNVTAKELTVTGATATSRDYIANDKTVDITGITLSGKQGTDDVSVEITGLKGTLSSANAGTYTSVTLPTLTLTGYDAENYEIVQPTSAVATDVTINKLNPTITVGETEYYKTFGDADFTLDITDDNPEANVTYSSNDENVVTVSNGTVTIKGAGITTITVSMGASTNYNAAVDKTVTVHVARAAYSVDTINKNYLYARINADSINLAELLPEDCGTVYYASVTSNGALRFISEPKVTNGILAYTLESGAADDTGNIVVVVETQNYEDITITVNVTLIDQIPVNVDGEVELNSNILTYGETLSGLTFKSVDFVDNAGNEVEGTLAWKEPSATPNAGTTSATWVFTPNNAEYASVEGTVAITVNKATPNVTGVPTVADRVYNPSVVLADSDLTGGTVKGVDGNSLAGSWSWQSTNVVPVVNNSGYIAVFTPTDSTNYETVTRTITVNVTKATPYVATKPTASALTYGQTLNQSVLSNGVIHYSETDSTVVAGSFAWEAGTVKPAVSDSATTLYNVLFTPDDSDNYKEVTVKLTVSVSKAEATALNNANKTYVYAESKNGESVSIEGLPEDCGSVSYEISSISDTNNMLENVSVDATGKLTYDVKSLNAYSNGLSATVTVTVSMQNYEDLTYTLTVVRTDKLVQNISAENISLTFGDNDTDIVVTGNKTELSYRVVDDSNENGDVVTVDSAGKVHIVNSGTATVEIKAEGSSSYAEAICEIQVTVAKRTVNVPAKDDTVYTYTGLPQTYSIASSPFYTIENTTQTNAGTYDVAVSLISDNYQWSAVLPEYKFVINPAQVTITAESHTVKQGDELPAFTYITTGLVNGENLPITVSVTCSATNSETVGTYDIVVSGPANEGNYTYTYKKGTLEVLAEDEAPFIMGDDGKMGWDAISDAIDDAGEGENIKVDMNGATVVPGDVIEEARDKGITISFVLDNGLTWTIDGSTVTDGEINNINFGTTVEDENNPLNNIPVGVINGVTGEKATIEVNLTYSGNFGFTAGLKANLGSDNAGYYANLYYYNPTTGKLEYVCADMIAANGDAELTFTHASDYLIVIDDEDLGKVKEDTNTNTNTGNNTNTNTGNNNTDNNSATTTPAATNGTVSNNTKVVSPDTGDEGAFWIWMLMLASLLGMAGAIGTKRVSGKKN